MTILGLDEREVRRHVDQTRPSSQANGVEDLAERFARAAWLAIAEPGDSAANILIDELGANAALRTVVERWSIKRVMALIADVRGQDLDGADIPEYAAAVASAFKRWTTRVEAARVMDGFDVASRIGLTLITPDDAEWPARVNDLGPHAPIALWLRGNVNALPTPNRSIALVGARASTGYGDHIAVEASSGLVDRGFAIVSGAAHGIDGKAHHAALMSGGTTIAFLAGGLDRSYPAAHEVLIDRIAETSAVLSEVPCGAAPTKWRFLQRNRLIAALADATVVVEAGWRSGSLNTAGHAASLGRPLGAVPGPVTSPASAGCHRLIREYDAVCVTNAQEMAELVSPFLAEGAELGEMSVGTAPANRESAAETRVVDALSRRTPRSVDDIARRSGISSVAVMATLGTLELGGLVRERETGWTLS